MKPIDAYKEMCRDIVQEQADPDQFCANAVRLTDAQLAVALRHYDDVLPEVAGEIQEQVCSALSGPNGFTMLFGSGAEAIGTAVIAGCRRRLMHTVRNDLECMASDLVIQAQDDAEYERGVTA